VGFFVICGTLEEDQERDVDWKSHFIPVSLLGTLNLM